MAFKNNIAYCFLTAHMFAQLWQIAIYGNATCDCVFKSSPKCAHLLFFHSSVSLHLLSPLSDTLSTTTDRQNHWRFRTHYLDFDLQMSSGSWSLVSCVLLWAWGVVGKQPFETQYMCVWQEDVRVNLSVPFTVEDSILVGARCFFLLWDRFTDIICKSQPLTREGRCHHPLWRLTVGIVTNIAQPNIRVCVKGWISHKRRSWRKSSVGEQSSTFTFERLRCYRIRWLNWNPSCCSFIFWGVSRDGLDIWLRCLQKDPEVGRKRPILM